MQQSGTPSGQGMSEATAAVLRSLVADGVITGFDLAVTSGGSSVLTVFSPRGRDGGCREDGDPRRLECQRATGRHRLSVQGRGRTAPSPPLIHTDVAAIDRPLRACGAAALRPPDLHPSQGTWTRSRVSRAPGALRVSRRNNTALGLFDLRPLSRRAEGGCPRRCGAKPPKSRRRAAARAPGRHKRSLSWPHSVPSPSSPVPPQASA